MKTQRVVWICLACIVCTSWLKAAEIGDWDIRSITPTFGSFAQGISGDYIAGVDNDDVWIYDMSDPCTPPQMIMDTPANYKQDDVYINGAKVVWCSKYQPMAPPPWPDDHIYTYDISVGGSPTLLASAEYVGPPAVYGESIVWVEADRESDPPYSLENRRMRMYDGSSYSTIASGDSVGNPIPTTGGHIYWVATDDVEGDAEIYFYNGSSITQLTNNDYPDTSMRVADGKAVWEGRINDVWEQREVFLHDGATVHRLTNNGYADTEPGVSGNMVTWVRTGYPHANDQQIWLYNISTSGPEVMISDPDMTPYDFSANYYPSISGGGNVAWRYYAQQIPETRVLFYDIADGSLTTLFSSNESPGNFIPFLSGYNAYWYDDSGNEWVAYYHPHEPTTLYVKADANGQGTSWDDALGSLQEAIDAAHSGDEIWIAQGTYKPDPCGLADPREATFELKNRVSIYGGFNSVGQPQWADRDPEHYQTILSGDIGQTDIDTDNCYHVVTANMIEPNTVLDGVTMTKGRADGASPHQRGGGLYCDSGTVIVSHCIFRDNISSEHGGGMYHIGSGNSSVTYCSFIENSSGGYGGGFCDLSGGDVTFDQCDFQSNQAGQGGGMAATGSTSATITNCSFIDNVGSDCGGLQTQGTSAQISNCYFERNEASSDSGGGLYNHTSTAEVTNCVFLANSADFAGGGIRNHGSEVSIANCTFTQNTAANGGGMYSRTTSGGTPSIVTVVNCIFWADSATSGYDELYTFGSGSSTTVAYSDIQGGYAGTGNINANPRFEIDAGPPATDLHLASTSPCIDAGDPSGDYSGQLDMDGQDRVAYDAVDMGADEVFPLPGDSNKDGGVDMEDFMGIAEDWLKGK